MKIKMHIRKTGELIFESLPTKNDWYACVGERQFLGEDPLQEIYVETGKIHPGLVGTVCIKTDVSPNSIRAGRSRDPIEVSIFSEDGVPGNMDYNSRRTWGWRGTTENVSCDAKGVRELLSIGPRKCGHGTIMVCGQRRDL